LTGQHLGDITGNLIGQHIGNVTGNLYGHVTGDITGNLAGKILISSSVTIEDGGGNDLLNTTVMVNYLDATGGSLTLQLDPGIDGPHLIVMMIYDTNMAVLSNANVAYAPNVTSITFAAIGDSATLLYTGTFLHLLNYYGCVVV